jgi:hypothetical protein
VPVLRDTPVCWPAAGARGSAPNPGCVADLPDQLQAGRDRELKGRSSHVWVRRTLLLLVAVIPVAALFNLFGQRPSTSLASTPLATLKVYSPSRLRGGLLYTSRFTVTAHRELKKAQLILWGGWMEQLTFNAVVPQPVSQASANGRLTMELGHIPAGKSFILYISYQVNPTNIGHRSQDVQLDDGKTEIVKIHRTVTFFP